MKITISRLMMIFFLVIAVTSSGVNVVAGEKEVVLDSEGNPVKTNTSYMVKVEHRGGTDWIAQFGMNDIDTFACPQKVVTSPSYGGHKIIFVSSSSDDDVVRESTEINIRMAFPGLCDESGFWRIRDSTLPEKEVVLTGSKSSDDSIFTLEKSDDAGYIISFGSADNPKEIGLSPMKTFAIQSAGLLRLVLKEPANYYTRFSVSFIPA